MPPRRPAWVLACCVLAGFAAPAARGASAYLVPEPGLAEEVADLAAQTDLPGLGPPYPAPRLRDALARVPEAERSRYQRVEAWLERAERLYGVTQAEFAGQGGDTMLEPVANRYGATAGRQATLAARAHLQPLPWVRVNAGGQTGRALDGAYRGNPDGTYAALGGRLFQIDVGWRPHWFGPGGDGALLLGTNAPAFPAVTVSNPAPIGPLTWSFSGFVGVLGQQASIDSAEGDEAGHPRLVGLHSSIQPAASLQLGFSALLQAGGGNRAFGELARPTQDTPLLTGEDGVGDLMLGLHTSYNIRWPLPARVYSTLAVEDTGLGELAYFAGDFADLALRWGVFLPELPSATRLRYEVVRWDLGWYTHHAYSAGNTHRGRVLGHWFADRRAGTEATRGLAQSFVVDQPLPGGRHAQAALRYSRPASNSGTAYVPGVEVSAQASQPTRAGRVLLRLTAGRSVFDRRFAVLAGALQWPP